jgi:hypothetical protein
MVNAASALIWSIVGPTAVFLGCCALGVTAPFRRVRGRRTLGYVQRSRITPSRCGLWPKVILYGGTCRIVAIDKDTVCDWLDRAGRHCRAVTTYLFDTLHITECQVDELWSFVRKKEAHLSVAEKVLALYGDAWVWIASRITESQPDALFAILLFNRAEQL